MVMTKWTANAILLIMTVTWAAISVRAGYFVQVSDKFLWIGGMIAGGDIGAAVIAKFRVVPKK